jgi:hypothetical protein
MTKNREYHNLISTVCHMEEALRDCKQGISHDDYTEAVLAAKCASPNVRNRILRLSSSSKENEDLLATLIW